MEIKKTNHLNQVILSPRTEKEQWKFLQKVYLGWKQVNSSRLPSKASPLSTPFLLVSHTHLNDLTPVLSYNDSSTVNIQITVEVLNRQKKGFILFHLLVYLISGNVCVGSTHIIEKKFNLLNQS